MSTQLTLIIGASEKANRFSNIATKLLIDYNIEVYAYSKREGNIEDIKIHKEWPYNKKIDTITLYISKKHQSEYYEKILRLKPRRVIFNPGTENDEFIEILESNDIEAILDCTLVMLETGYY